jgi:hypothetical protein
VRDERQSREIDTGYYGETPYQNAAKEIFEQ